MVDFVLERGNYWAIIGLMMIGLYMAFAATNLIKRPIGLGTFQTSIILFDISLARMDGATAPILMGEDYKSYSGGGKNPEGEHAGEAAHAVAEGAHGATEAGLEYVYSNPLPHVLMLTAIVVGVATLAVGLALIVRIREAYGSVEIDDIMAMDLAVAKAEASDDAAERPLSHGGSVA